MLPVVAAGARVGVHRLRGPQLRKGKTTSTSVEPTSKREGKILLPCRPKFPLKGKSFLPVRFVAGWTFAPGSPGCPYGGRPDRVDTTQEAAPSNQAGSGSRYGTARLECGPEGTDLK